MDDKRSVTVLQFGKRYVAKLLGCVVTAVCHRAAYRAGVNKLRVMKSNTASHFYNSIFLNAQYNLY